MPVTAAPLHVPLPQVVPCTYLRQAPCPSHVPSSPHVATSLAGQVVAARGLMPSGTNEQVPIAPGTLHALQVSVHAVSQHTPSTQKADWQSALHPHAAPLVTWAPPTHFVITSAEPSGVLVASIGVAMSLLVAVSVDCVASALASFECEPEPPPHPTTTEATPTKQATADRKFCPQTK
jgi:hypothetical protein